MNMIMALFKETFLPPGSGTDMEPWVWSWSYHMGLFSMLMMAVFWIVVILGIISLIRWLTGSSRQKDHEVRSADSALEILKIRYARGEIGKEEFEQKKKDLGYS